MFGTWRDVMVIPEDGFDRTSAKRARHRQSPFSESIDALNDYLATAPHDDTTLATARALAGRAKRMDPDELDEYLRSVMDVAHPRYANNVMVLLGVLRKVSVIPGEIAWPYDALSVSPALLANFSEVAEVALDNGAVRHIAGHPGVMLAANPHAELPTAVVQRLLLASAEFRQGEGVAPEIAAAALRCPPLGRFNLARWLVTRPQRPPLPGSPGPILTGLCLGVALAGQPAAANPRTVRVDPSERVWFGVEASREWPEESEDEPRSGENRRLGGTERIAQWIAASCDGLPLLLAAAVVAAAGFGQGDEPLPLCPWPFVQALFACAAAHPASAWAPDHGGLEELQRPGPHHAGDDEAVLGAVVAAVCRATDAQCAALVRHGPGDASDALGQLLLQAPEPAEPEELLAFPSAVVLRLGTAAGSAWPQPVRTVALEARRVALALVLADDPQSVAPPDRADDPLVQVGRFIGARCSVFLAGADPVAALPAALRSIGGVPPAVRAIAEGGAHLYPEGHPVVLGDAAPGLVFPVAQDGAVHDRSGAALMRLDYGSALGVPLDYGSALFVGDRFALLCELLSRVEAACAPLGKDCLGSAAHYWVGDGWCQSSVEVPPAGRVRTAEEDGRPVAGRPNKGFLADDAKALRVIGPLLEHAGVSVAIVQRSSPTGGSEVFLGTGARPVVAAAAVPGLVAQAGPHRWYPGPAP